MNWLLLVDSSSFLLSIATKVTLIHQILKIRKLKSAKELSFPLVVVSAASCADWTISGIGHHYWSLIAGQLPGAILFGILVTQYLYYRRKHD